MGDSEHLQQDVILGHENGLHLTPITKLVQRVSQFQSDVTLEFDGKSASAKSAVELMLLGATFGARLHVEATGIDAADAMSAAAAILEAP